MTYAGERVCWDADSHLMETPEFLAEHADPAYREALRIAGGDAGGEQFATQFEQMIASVRKRMADSEKTRELEQNVIASAKGWYAHGAMDPAERSRTLDLLGFRGQLVFSTFTGVAFATRDLDQLYAGTRAHTRAVAGFCAHDERLLPVARIPLEDPARALDELEFALGEGVAAVHVSADAPGGNRKGVSPAHVDLEGFWARLAESRLPAVLHVGGGSLLPRAYHRNGRPRPKDWLGGGENLRAKDFPATAHAPQNFLTCLILDGVLERHPGLRCGVIELGASWVPGFLRNLDHAFDNFRKHEPLLQDLSLRPSEYVSRQVRFTPFPFEDVGWLVSQCGEELFLFSSDYPHPEGGRDPIGRFEASFEAAGTPVHARERFYRANFEALMQYA